MCQYSILLLHLYINKCKCLLPSIKTKEAIYVRKLEKNKGLTCQRAVNMLV